MKKIILLFVCLAFFSISLYAGSRNERAQTAPLRVGILPDADSLPLMLARDHGFFEREGVAVELILFSNPQERDAAIQAGRLDGAISDLLAAAFLNAAGYDFKVASLTSGRYGIISSPQSGITTLSELRGKRIGLSVNTIIQYTVDAQLEAAGISMNEYEAVAVPRMPLRLEMVLGGQIESASLPEPLLTAAVVQGAVLLSTTDTTGIEAGILLFSKRALDNRLEDVKAFYRAYYNAASAINANPDAYRNYLVEQAGFPSAIRDAYQFVYYRTPRLPDSAQILRVIRWLRNRNLLNTDISPQDMVDSRGISEFL